MTKVYIIFGLLLHCFFIAAQSVPSVTTTSATSITQTNAVSGGDVTSNGGASINSRGVCWSTSGDPTIYGGHTVDGYALGAFSSFISGLSPSTTYYIRAYATNSAGTGYGSTRSFTTPGAGKPTVNTGQASSITQATASCGGNVVSTGGVSVTERGVCWGISLNPTTSNYKATSGSGEGSYMASLTGLNAGTTYHYRAYAINSYGTSYGSDITFTTSSPIAPTIVTTTVTGITYNSASSGGNITSSGGANVTARGVCWNTSANPTTANSKTTDGSGTGSFTSAITGLLPGTTYHLRAYATNSAGTGYGSDVNFVTAATIPTVNTVTASSVTSNSATAGGNVSMSGGADVTSRGVCWSTSENPTTTNSLTSDGNGTGTFTSNITGLLPGTAYHYRAYATNSAGISYGSDLILTTSSVLPTVSAIAASGITLYTASSGGNITSNGGAEITARGVCWATTVNPTISNYKTSDGTGTGSYTSSISGLTPGTTYHIRAYATNSVGTNYSDDITFASANPYVPVVNTLNASEIAYNAAVGSGNVVDDGGSGIISRGICWSTSANPTVSNANCSNGAGVGTFSCSLSGLTPSTTYYLRAFATNSVGTGYGSQQSFVTSTPLAYWLMTGNNIFYLDGNVGIGTNNPTATLTVDGKILAKEVETNSEIESDYVFGLRYELMSLDELKLFIIENKHLPDVPSVKEWEKTGQQLSKTDDLLLRKIEELTLYIIEQNKKIEALKSEIEDMKDYLNN